MSAYLYRLLKNAGLCATKDEPMLWELIHELGAESLTALLEMDRSRIFVAVRNESAELGQNFPELDSAA